MMDKSKRGDNIMTEEEAKTKWCPQVRYVVNASDCFMGNRFDHAFEEECKCIASDCAMWVWDRKPLTDDQLRQQSGQLGSGRDKLGPCTGHCGLVRN